jgi:hypothetical protein
LTRSPGRVVARAAGLAALAAGCVGIGVGSFAQTTPPRDFGRPPSGAIPIFFNDEHVYAKPDLERANRVLAGLVRNGTLLVPLRSMFEQMGAAVSWDEATRTADVAKPGADVKVTVGRAVVVVNGEERPLDVPPMIYRGVVVVPVRVVAEAMGAYVQWLPDRRVVVVRFLGTPVPPPPAPTAAPAPPPTAAPIVTPAPTPPPTPTPAPAPRRYEAFVAGDFLISPKIYNEASPGNTASGSYGIRGAIEFPLVALPAMIEVDYRHYRFPHTANQTVAGCPPGGAGCATVAGNQVYNTGLCPSPTDPGCVTVAGYQPIIAYNGLGQAYVPAFTGTEDEGDVRVGVRIFEPRVYIGAAYLAKTYTYLGYPRISGAGFGITKLPDLDVPLSLEGSLWYYPSISGNYTYPVSPFLGPLSGQTIPFSYAYWKYRAGATLNLGKSGIFVDLGYAGERGNARSNAPSNTTVNGVYAGAGVHL